MGPLAIRAAATTEAPAISALIQRTVRITNSPDYAPDIVNLVCTNFTLGKVIQKMAERDMFVGFQDEALAGTISLGGGKLHSLFVEPSLQRRGIGTQLVGFLEKHAIKGAFRCSVCHRRSRHVPFTKASAIA